MVDPRFFAPADIAGAYHRGLAFHEQRQQRKEERENKKRLGDLIPQALGRGGMGEGGAVSREQAITEIFGIDHNLAMKLDDRQREQAKAELDDLSAAVRWADTPEKWQQVQQHFGQKGVDLSPYGFEHREEGLLKLGQLGSYLESLPKPELRNVGPGEGVWDMSGGQPRVVIAPNDGSQPVGAPVQSAGGDLPRVSGEAEYNSLRPGQRYVGPDGQIRVKRGGPTPQASGGFPSAGN